MRLHSILLLSMVAIAAGCGGPGGAYLRSDSVPYGSRPSMQAQAPRADLPDGFTVDEAVEEALLRNRGLQAALAAWAASANVPAQAVWPPFPTATYMAGIEPIETRLGPARNSLVLMQPIPFPGKLILRGEIASSAAEVVRQKYLETLNRVVEETKAAVYELAWVHEAARITQETRDLLRHMEEVAVEKYKVNQVTQQDVLKAQVERSRIENDLLSLEDERQSAIARLIALLDRPTGTEVGRPARVEVRERIPDLERLYDLARSGRPEIAAAEAAVRREEAGLTLRKEGYIPDLALGVQYVDIGGGPDAFGLLFGLTLPLWIPQVKASVREGQKRLESTVSGMHEVANRTFFEVKDNHARWQTATRLVQLYRDTLIPQAELSYRAAEAGYIAGKVDFLNYLDGQRTLLDFRLAFERAKVDAQERLATLERAVGQGF